jgi:hypothetical protein
MRYPQVLLSVPRCRRDSGVFCWQTCQLAQRSRSCTLPLPLWPHIINLSLSPSLSLSLCPSVSPSIHPSLSLYPSLSESLSLSRVVQVTFPDLSYSFTEIYIFFTDSNHALSFIMYYNASEHWEGTSEHGGH